MLTYILIYTPISIAIIILLIYGLKNITKKHENLERYILKQNGLFESLKYIVDMSDKKIHELDVRQTFESDDEVGTFFKNVKEIQRQLNNYFELEQTNPDENKPKAKTY
jgi:hypothetical protein